MAKSVRVWPRVGGRLPVALVERVCREQRLTRGYVYMAVSSCADQRALGMSMRVERSSLSQVQDRLEMHKRKHEEEKTKGGTVKQGEFDVG